MPIYAKALGQKLVVRVDLKPKGITAAQPSADQRRRASVVIGAVLPKNAKADELLRCTRNPSSFKKRISAFQMDKIRVNTPM